MMAGMRARQSTHFTARKWVVAVLAGVVALGATGCSWRLEEEPVVYPSADQVTLARDAAAKREQQIIDALATNADGDGSTSDLAVFELLAAPVHVDALGGVYVATPSPAPSPSPSPIVGSLADAVAQARDAALESAQTTTDANLALLQSSIGLTHGLALWFSTTGGALPVPDASATPSSVPSSTRSASPSAEPDVAATASPRAAPEPVTSAERILPSSVNLGESFTPASTETISPDTFGDLAVAHDKARFLYELIAARSSGGERANALARRDIHASRSAEFAALAGSDDRRQILYDVPLADVADAAARARTALDTEFALGATYASMLNGVANDDRGWILNASFDAYAAGALQSGFTPDMFPVLPGIESAP